MTKINRKDWRNLPTSEWNTLSFTEYFRDMNADKYGMEPYVPLRNWRYEQAQIKRALDAYGPELLRAAFDECFSAYRPTREYPILTAGFCVSYRINGIMPRLLAESQRKASPVTDQPSVDEVRAWL